MYVGGEFTAIGGTNKRSIVRVNAITGVVDPGFTSAVRGRVNVLVAANGRLYAGGSFAAKLVALNPETGANTNTFNLAITDPLPNAWGTVTILGMAISPDGRKLVATGNFRQVGGPGEIPTLRRESDAAPDQATLDPWYYQPFAAPAPPRTRAGSPISKASTSPRTAATSSVAATGQIPRVPSDIGVTVCDAVGRFDLSNDNADVWINYTGGDSVWAVSATGAVVYAQGHFQWLDNPNGHASQDGGGAARRLGIGAIHPTTGLARDVAWDPPKRAAVGGKALLATAAGLWVGSDSANFNGEPRRGLAFCPLPLVP